MTFDPYGQQQAGFPVVPQVPVAGAPPWTMPMPPVTGGPLEGLQDSVAGVLSAADSRHLYLPGPQGSMLQLPRGRQSSVARDMAYGAAAGYAGWLIWRGMQRRKATKGEYTSPGYRCLAILLLPPVLAFCLSMVWVMESGKLMGTGIAAGVILATVYAVYRFTGHGRYNTRRRGAHRLR